MASIQVFPMDPDGTTPSHSLPVEQPSSASPTAGIETLLDTDELNRLIAALEEHQRCRQPVTPEKDTERRAALRRAVCLMLAAGPAELGTAGLSPQLKDLAGAALEDVRVDDEPEARVCRLWLACASNQMHAETASEWETLASESLWEPVRALAYRALAHLGRRQTLARLLPQRGPLSLAQADAWLEASHVEEHEEDVVARITAGESPLPRSVQDRWRALLQAEIALACQGVSPAVIASLATLLDFEAEPPPSPYGQAESRRLAARAAAALTRGHLALNRNDPGPLLSRAGKLLPVWERRYLQGLTSGQLHQDSKAAAALRTSLTQNSGQTAVRLALAVQISAGSPGASLQVLECEEPTRELLVTRAALLARQERFEEAEEALALLAGTRVPGREPWRFRWAQTQAHYGAQEQRLRTALAERRGDWKAARTWWQLACKHQPSLETLHWARRLFAAEKELQRGSPGHGWQHSTVEQRRHHAEQKVGAVPLVGNALFFRAAASCKTQPQRAQEDLLTLLRQRAWVAREMSVGGGRLSAAGDLLLQLGLTAEAKRVYQRVGSSAELKQRHAVALVYEQVRKRAAPEVVGKALDQAIEQAVKQPLAAAAGRNRPFSGWSAGCGPGTTDGGPRTWWPRTRLPLSSCLVRC